ncbi:MAG: hypothetical protein FWG77_02715 [Treponema sp.]|nr:hypothetical protein [Treponema sp.]
MVENDKEEQFKDRIFTIFTDYHNEAASDNRYDEFFPLLCGQIYKWCKEFRFEDDIDIMGEEIADVCTRVIKNDKLTQSKEGFFKYLYDSLEKGRAAYYRNYDEKKIVKISRYKKRILKEIRDLVRMCEIELGVELTPDEKIEFASGWFNSWEYNFFIDKLYRPSPSIFIDKDCNEVDVFDTEVAPPYSPRSIHVTPLNDLLIKLDTEIIRNAIKNVLGKKQKRSRACYKAIFTLHCIEKIRNYKVLDRVLDKKVIKEWEKSNKKLTQYEVYRKHRPGVSKESALAISSRMLTGFIIDLESYLSEKNPEVFQSTSPY